MNIPKIPQLDSIGLLFALLPGVLAYVIVRALTARDKQFETTEVVLHGLAYTLAINALWATLVRAGNYFPTPDVVGLCLTATVFGIALSCVINSGFGYGLLSKVGLTRESPWSTVWESAFKMTSKEGKELSQYATIELKDGRRILGAIRYYSSSQKNGHVAIDRASWLFEDRVEPTPGLLVFRGEDIEIIQFMPKEASNGGGQTTTTTTNPKALAGPEIDGNDYKRIQSTGNNNATPTPTASATEEVREVI